ncbi:hypothetical protein BaRGS_00029261 [Batillaria attramentaria]|uniref:Uncharacterized protein n=1 Tax=Batillaria attramentaria TaxID=370345 RepID=A0ABD0JXP6_9CAEN
MAEERSQSSLRGRSELLKKLSAGKTVCSEVNKASSNTNFLYMRRHHAFVTQLESAKQSMMSQNGKAQKDMRKRLDTYKKRKRIIFRERVMSQQLSDDESEADASLGQSLRSATSRSSIGGGGRKSSGGYSVPILPPGGSGISGGMFPSILRVPMVASDDENLQSTIQRQLRQHMRRQENLHAQILRSRVHEFCNELNTVHSSGGHSFYVTSSKRRIAFSEIPKSANRIKSANRLTASAGGGVAGSIGVGVAGSIGALKTPLASVV